MTKYILHGGFNRVDNELNRSFFSECMKDLKEDCTVLLVLFATRDENEKPIQFDQQNSSIQSTC